MAAALGSIFSFILAAAKAVPIIDKWLTTFFEMYYQDKVKNIQNYHTTKEAKKSATIVNIQKAKTHEEKRVLMSLLADIERM